MVKVNLFSIHFCMANLSISTKKVNFFTRQKKFFWYRSNSPVINPFRYWSPTIDPTPSLVIDLPIIDSLSPAIDLSLLSPLSIHPSPSPLSIHSSPRYRSTLLPSSLSIHLSLVSSHNPHRFWYQFDNVPLSIRWQYVINTSSLYFNSLQVHFQTDNIHLSIS
jgi:hypothetical protein